MSGVITNPNQAFQHGTPNPIGDQFSMGSDFCAASATNIPIGAPVALVYDATAKTMKVELWDTDAATQSVHGGRGVAVQPITADKAGRVVLFGYAEVNVGAGVAAENLLANGTTTAGVAGVDAATDATDIAETFLGVYLGVKNAANLAPIWVKP